MTTFKKQVTIDAAQELVWQIVSNLGDIYKFHPGVSKSYYTSKIEVGMGAARICELQPTGRIRETVVQWNEGSGFLLHIDPIEKAPPVDNFSGNFELEQVDANKTSVSLTIQYDMKLGLIGELLNKLVIKSKMEEGIEALLQGLKIHTEKGLEIKDVKSLRRMLKAA